jgi:hypothetical protein
LQEFTGRHGDAVHYGDTLMENRNGLVVQAELTHADGHDERRAAMEMT